VGRAARAALAPAVAALTMALAPALTQPPSPPVSVNSLGMRMVLVPAGRFGMGSPAGAPMRQEEEWPHQVTLTKPFRISATEVTQGQWRALMPGRVGSPAGDDLPVVSLGWMEAVEFCRKLSEREKSVYRLPTEAEWEYACRANAQDPAATAGLDAVAWYADDSDGMAHAVGTKKPNAWGLLDMLGNVAEWTADVYAAYPHEAEQTDPAGPASGTSRVVRGGSFRSFPPALRCAARTGTPESYQLAHLGFRVVQQE